VRVLVTGATGFIGTSLVRRLRAEQMDVRALVHSPEKAATLANLGVEIVVGDITDLKALRAAVDGIETVYHLAGRLLMPGVPASEYWRTHYEGTQCILDVCHSNSSFQRFILCSSTGVLGPTGEHPADESAPAAPTNVYEETKWRAEELVQRAIHLGMPGVIIRPGFVYGPGDSHLLGFFKMVQRRLFRPIGRKPVVLHPLYVDDLTDAWLLAASVPQALGECFHISGAETVDIAELAKIIARAVGSRETRGWVPSPLAWGLGLGGDFLASTLHISPPLTRSRLDFLTNSRVYDVSKAQRLLGFTAKTDLACGITQTVRWYQKIGSLPPPLPVPATVLR